MKKIYFPIVAFAILAFAVAASIAGGGKGILKEWIFYDGFEHTPNRPPIAHAGGDGFTLAGVPFSLDGSGSYDPDGDALSYRWEIASAPAGSGSQLFDASKATAILIPDQPGQYEINLTVHDGEYESTPSTAIIHVTGNLAGSAWIGPDGGAVGLWDGASILIPPGALDSAVEISISSIPLPPQSILPATGVLVGNVYEMQPSGMEFNRPAQIIIPYNHDDIPAGRTPGSVSIYRKRSLDTFNMVGSASDDDDDESHGSGQLHLEDNHQYVAMTYSFSAYAAISVNSSQEFTDTVLTLPSSKIVVRRPPALRTDRPVSHKCERSQAQQPIPTRQSSAIGAIVIHSTNNGNRTRDFNSELGWAADDCNRHFAHYYIDRDGAIYQIADDTKATSHTLTGSIGIENENAIGIELFLNVGEPYDGHQISSLIRLVDFLLEKYDIERPSRNQATGLIERNVAHINQGGDRIVNHKDVDGRKCDPAGTFMDSQKIQVIDLRPDPVCRRHPEVITDFNVRPPALIDIVLDMVASLTRDGQHTGIINTHGGDSYEVGNPGNAGKVSFYEDPVRVDSEIGSHIRLTWQENSPTETGPGALVVTSGSSLTASSPLLVYTDVIIAGDLYLNQDTTFHVTGTFYLAPNGKIISRNNNSGGNLTVYSRGTPIIQGLIDARGEDGVEGTPNGGNGGDIAFYYSAPGMLLIPTIYARGGDSDTANVSLANGGPSGGNGGNITIDTRLSAAPLPSHLFLGGGVGPLIGSARVPTWRSAAIDPALLELPWAGDYLPPAPPMIITSYGVTTPSMGQRVPKRWGISQPGFTRGLLTTGGMGGVAIGGDAVKRNGGPAGHGGNITIAQHPEGTITFRDIDIVTGMEIETVIHRFYLYNDDPNMNRRTCTASGAHGGSGINYGTRGGDGGAGGNAGALSVSGGTISPAANSYSSIYEIKGFPPGQRLQDADSYCSRGSQTLGHVVEAKSASGDSLYRLRVNTARTALLGGLGGIPRGSAAATYTGDVGLNGESAPLSGLPIQ